MHTTMITVIRHIRSNPLTRYTPEHPTLTHPYIAHISGLLDILPIQRTYNTFIHMHTFTHIYTFSRKHIMDTHFTHFLALDTPTLPQAHPFTHFPFIHIHTYTKVEKHIHTYCTLTD